MNLEKFSIVEKQAATMHWPVLIVGSNSSGKTFALENMPAEDKKRTMVLNFDNKPIGLKTDEFAAVFSISSSKDKLEEQLAALPPEADEYRKHFKKVIASTYFMDDVESVDKVVKHILKATFSPKIDRIVVDSFTNLDLFAEYWGQANAPDSRAGWGLYGAALQQIMQAVKEATIFGFKFTYVYGHHSFIPAAQYDTTPKKVTEVKGNIMKGNVETGFNTIIYSHRLECGTIVYECDSANQMDTSRTKLVDTKFRFERTSLDDIEQLLNHKKKVVDGKLVELDYVAPKKPKEDK